MKMKKENKRGISLIVLVITIIVMIILAGAIILSLSSNGIIGKANQAKIDTDIANLKEAAAIALAEYDLEVSTGGIDKEETTAVEYIKEKLSSQGFSKYHTNLIYLSESGKVYVYNEPKIPAGFVKSSISTEDEVIEGLVIYEGEEPVTETNHSTAMKTRNQYVWVPVPDMSEFVLKDGFWNGSEETYVACGIVTEPFSKTTSYGVTLSLTNDLTGEHAEYAKMKTSVEKYGGFYIGRYEAGDGDAKETRTAVTTGLNTVISKKEAFVYSHVGWGYSMTNVERNVTDGSNDRGPGAVKLARSVYPEADNYEIVSTLCYGVQWDAMMTFMKDVVNPLTSSGKYIQTSYGMGWLNYNYSSGNPKHLTGEDLNRDTNSDGINDYVALNKVKNIYDLYGNVFEWTMDAWNNEQRCARGASYVQSSMYTVSRRAGDYVYGLNILNYTGFRVALYLK